MFLHTCIHNHNRNCGYDKGHTPCSYKRTPPVCRYWRFGPSSWSFVAMTLCPLVNFKSLILAMAPRAYKAVIRGSQGRSVIWSHLGIFKHYHFLHLFKDIYWRYANKWCILKTFKEYQNFVCIARFSNLYPMLHFPKSHIFRLQFQVSTARCMRCDAQCRRSPHAHHHLRVSGRCQCAVTAVAAFEDSFFWLCLIWG